MTGPGQIIHCPYCGEANTEEHDELMNLLRGEVYSLNCRKCGKSSGIILYEGEL